MCKRQSITTESIFGEEEEELDVDDSPSPSSVPQLVPTLQNDVAKKRAKLVRKQSVMQYVKDQHSIDDDPVTSLYAVSSKHILALLTWGQKWTVKHENLLLVLINVCLCFMHFFL